MFTYWSTHRSDYRTRGRLRRFARCKTAGVGAVILPAMILAAAADAQQRLPETIVTATRVATPLEQTAASVTIVTAEEIEASGDRTIVEVLRKVPGLNIVQSGGSGTITSVFMRGGNSNHTLILIDGIEVSDPTASNGAFNFAHLLTNNIERIEILRGPLSTIYGSDVIGGVINIITKRGGGPTRATVRVEGGSFGAFNQAASLTGGTDRIDFVLSVDHFRDEGISITPRRLRPAGVGAEKDGYENLTASVRLTGRLTEQAGLSLFVQSVETDAETDDTAEDPNSREETEQLFAQLEGRLKSFGGALDQTLALEYTHHDRFNENPADSLSANFSRGTNDGTKVKLRYLATLSTFDSHLLSFGAETESEDIETQVSFSSGFTSATIADTRNNAVFVQDQAAFGDSLFVTGAVRIDDHERFGRHVTFRIAPAYLLRQHGTKLTASFGTGFKAPSLFHLFGSSSFLGFTTFTGNPNLKPETSRSWEAGIEQDLFGGRARAGATYFRTDIKNLIVSTPTFTSVENRSEAKIYGVEAFFQATPHDGVTLRADYTFVRAEDGSNGQDLLRRPKHKANAALDYAFSAKGMVGISATYVGRRRDIDAVTFARIVTDDFTTVGLHASYDVTPTFQVFGRLSNLLDAEIEDPDGFSQPGRAVFAGLRATF